MLMPRHYIFYGDPGAGKSHCAASAPLPSFIVNFDGLAKASPYFTIPHEFMPDFASVDETLNGLKVNYETVKLYDPADVEREHPQRIIVNLVDNKPEVQPIAWQLFKDKLWPIIDNLVAKYSARTLIIDSGTLMQLAFKSFALKWGGSRGAISDGERGIAREMTDALEKLFISLVSKPYDTILITHIAKEEQNNQGVKESVAALPGRLARYALAMHSETYRIYVNTSGVHLAQCQHDGHFIANNSVRAPKECENLIPIITKNSITARLFSQSFQSPAASTAASLRDQPTAGTP